MMMRLTCLLQILLKGGQCLLGSSQIIRLQRTLQGLDILPERTALPCLRGACHARHSGTRRAILLQSGKGVLRPLEITSLEGICQALKVLLSLFAGASDGGWVAIGTRTYSRNGHRKPLQRKKQYMDWTLVLRGSNKCTKWTVSSPNCIMRCWNRG